MVFQEKFDGDKSFKCEECGFHFKQETLAKKCENHCRDKGICSTKITAKSLERN